MAYVIEQQPQNSLAQPPGSSGPVRIRTMRKNEEDCKFVANLAVEAFRDKFVHATSERSIPKVKNCTEKENSIQDPWFYERNFIAEYDGQPAGLLTLKHYGDPEPRSGDSYNSLGCCDSIGMCCLSCGSTSDVSQGKVYLDHICVDDKFRGKGIGKVLMDRAEYEAKSKGCRKIFLYVSWTNRAKNLYERQGYRITESTCCCGFVWCTTGLKGVYKMEKDLVF